MQLSTRPHLAHKTVISPTRRTAKRNTPRRADSERGHHRSVGPNRTRTQPHTTSAERRHSFAVDTLLDWYRSGIDVNGRMVVLSAYLGHVHPAGTYWYLSAAPELMELAAARLTGRAGARS